MLTSSDARGTLNIVFFLRCFSFFRLVFMLKAFVNLIFNMKQLLFSNKTYLGEVRSRYPEPLASKKPTELFDLSTVSGQC